MHIASWPHRSWLRSVIFGLVVVLAIGALAVFALWLLPIWLSRQPFVADHAARQKVIADTRSSSATVLVAIGGLLTVLYTARTFRLSARTQELAAQTHDLSVRNHELIRTGQVTDRYAKAIEQLGSETRDVRLGGIYALERIMRDSPEDQATIVEVLSAFVREHAAWNATDQKADDPTAETIRPSVDVQAALTVIGRRPRVQEKWRMRYTDLRHSDLRGAEFDPGALLEGANLQGTHLDGAKLWAVRLEGANLHGAHLEKAQLMVAQLQGAHLKFAHLEKALLWGTRLEGAHLWGASLTAAELQGAHLYRSQLTAEQLATAENAHEIVWVDEEQRTGRVPHVSVADLTNTATAGQDEPQSDVGSPTPDKPESPLR